MIRKWIVRMPVPVAMDLRFQTSEIVGMTD